MAKTSQPTGEELLEHHIHYELTQMNQSLRMLGDVKVPEAWIPREVWQKALNNALIESFCVHARVLFEFFTKERGAKAYAIDGYRPFRGADVSGWQKKLNNQIAHVLDGRTADDNLKISGSDRIVMHNLLAAETKAFKASLKPELSKIPLPDIDQIVLAGPGQGATNAILHTE